MKRYVSLAGALLLGTVVASEPKNEFGRAIAPAKKLETPSNVVAVKKNTNVKPAKRHRTDSRDGLSAITSHDEIAKRSRSRGSRDQVNQVERRSRSRDSWWGEIAEQQKTAAIRRRSWSRKSRDASLDMVKRSRSRHSADQVIRKRSWTSNNSRNGAVEVHEKSSFGSWWGQKPARRSPSGGSNSTWQDRQARRRSRSGHSRDEAHFAGDMVERRRSHSGSHDMSHNAEI